jgi:hypothetical protein
MRALHLYAGPRALQFIAKNGLQPHHIQTIPGAAGGPKGLILGALDRFIFGDWLAQSNHCVDLVGASIGAWRMATACLTDPVPAFERLEHDYIRQHYALEPGEKRPDASLVSEMFGKNLKAFYGGRVAEVLNHPRYRLHIMTSRGRHLLASEHGLRTPVGYLGAFLTNAVHRKAMGAWLERVVFSSVSDDGQCAALPFATRDYPTRQVALSEANFSLALQASCSIPFILRAVSRIPGAPRGAYWDGGITDYHLHLDYAGAKVAMQSVATHAHEQCTGGINGLVLYPHFQKQVVPGWLDKSLKWRHHATRHLDSMLLLAPNPEWVKTLPNGKLPDRTDFTYYGNDLAGRVKAWSSATSACEQLAQEFAEWLERPDVQLIKAL